MTELDHFPELPEFDNIPVGTRTFIVMTNMTVNISALFKFFPLTKYIVIPKKRGRKKKNKIEDPNKNIKDGSIITLELAREIRGVSLKNKKKNGEIGDFFRNSLTVVMFVEGKKLNFKISQNGKFQITGCKTEVQAEKCIKYIWAYIKDAPDLYKLASSKYLKATFIPAMRNILFNLNFKVNTEKLSQFFNSNSYKSLLETGSYTGVNIKFPINQAMTDLKLKQIIYKVQKSVWCKPIQVPYEYYLKTLKQKEIEKKLEKKRYNTFLVFHSGKVIMSSICAEFARDTYYLFTNLIRENYKLFKENLDTS